MKNLATVLVGLAAPVATPRATRWAGTPGAPCGRMAQGNTNAASAEALTLTPRAVEKYVNAIFSKLPLGQARDVDRRVTAVLLFLSDNA